MRWRAVSGSCELPRDLVCDPLSIPGRDEGNDAAAETASGHSRAERTRGSRRFDGEIYLRHGDLEVVAHGLVRGVQQRRQVGNPPRPQYLDSLQHPGVLTDHVMYPPPHHRIGKLFQRGTEIGDVAQRCHAEQPGGLLATGAAGGVLTID